MILSAGRFFSVCVMPLGQRIVSAVYGCRRAQAEMDALVRGREVRAVRVAKAQQSASAPDLGRQHRPVAVPVASRRRSGARRASGRRWGSRCAAAAGLPSLSTTRTSTRPSLSNRRPPGRARRSGCAKAGPAGRRHVGEGNGRRRRRYGRAATSAGRSRWCRCRGCCPGHGRWRSSGPASRRCRSRRTCSRRRRAACVGRARPVRYETSLNRPRPSLWYSDLASPWNVQTNRSSLPSLS